MGAGMVATGMDPEFRDRSSTWELPSDICTAFFNSTEGNGIDVGNSSVPQNTPATPGCKTASNRISGVADVAMSAAEKSNVPREVSVEFVE